MPTVVGLKQLEKISINTWRRRRGPQIKQKTIQTKLLWILKRVFNARIMCYWKPVAGSAANSDGRRCCCSSFSTIAKAFPNDLDGIVRQQMNE